VILVSPSASCEVSAGSTDCRVRKELSSSPSE
jgi:hypothetical protein